MSLINDIKAILDTSLANSDSNYTLPIRAADFDYVAGSSYDPYIQDFADFIRVGLGLESTEITQQVVPGAPPPFVDLDDNTDILSIKGITDALFGDTQKDANFSLQEVDDNGTIRLKVELEVVFRDEAETLDLPGLSWLSPDNLVGYIQMDPQTGIQESKEGKLHFSAFPIDIRLNRINQNEDRWTLDLTEAEASQTKMFNLDDLAQLVNVANTDLSDFLSPGLQSLIFDSGERLQLDTLSANLDFTTDSMDGFAVDMTYHNADDPDDSGNWTLFNSFAIRDLHFAFNLDNSNLALRLAGAVNIGDTDLPAFYAEGNLGGPGIWSAGMDASGTTDPLSGLTDLLAIIGDDLTDTVPNEIRSLELPSLDTLDLSFDPVALQLHDLHFKVVKQSAIDLIPGFLTVDNMTAELNFNNLQDDEAKSINGTVQCGLPVGPRQISLQLTKEANSDAWIFSGGIPATSDPITLRNMYETFLGDFFQDEHGSPIWPGDELGIGDGPKLPNDLFFKVYLNEYSFDPGDGSIEIKKPGAVDFNFLSADDINILEYFSIKNWGFEFSKPEHGLGVSGFFTGEMPVSNEVTIAVKALIPEKESEGLVLSGYAEKTDGFPVGDLVETLAETIDPNFEIPDCLSDFTISRIGGSYSAGGDLEKELIFECAGEIPLDEVSLQPNVEFKYVVADGAGLPAMRGALTFDFSEGATDPMPLDSEGNAEAVTLEFSVLGDSNVFVADYHIPDGKTCWLNTIVEVFSPSLANAVPQIEIPLQGLFLAYKKRTAPDTGGIFLMGMALSMEMDFSQIPLVGSQLSEDEAIGVDNLLLYHATDSWAINEIETINNELQENLRLPTEEAISSEFKTNLAANLSITEEPLYLPMVNNSADDLDAAESVNATDLAPLSAPGPSDPGKWFNLNKQLGPLFISRIGTYFLDGKLLFMLDAGLTIGGLSLTLEDLSFGSPLDHFAPEFNLRGLGMALSKPPIELSGLFLRTNNESAQHPNGLIADDRFTGSATIKTSELSISAIGEYASVNGEPSFYLYAYMGYPIGGPSFFFVEGLSAGFGYNRSFQLPSIDQVENHPMVAIAMQEDANLLDLADSLIEGNYIPIDPGELFFSAGVRFTTFKLLDSFLLLAASFSDPFRVDLLGVSKLVLPTPVKGKPPVTPLAEVSLNLLGTFIPDEGFLGIQGQLSPDSYILSKDCSLEGGFAFYSWFKDKDQISAGDFVLTLGGYHPAFNKPAHYPYVPRLGFNWDITSKINVKGQMYFALTPSAVMAGGNLDAHFDDGDLQAWFLIGADFLIGWKPYHYDARMYLNFGGSYTFWAFGEQTVSFEMGADMHIWGPEFAGTAHIDMEIVSFDVDFGSASKDDPSPLEWDEFQQSFIPETTASVNIVNGLIKTTEDESWIVNPKDLILQTDSVIPLEEITLSTEVYSGDSSFGIAPMNKKAGSVNSDLQIEVFNSEGVDMTDSFAISQITKDMPKAVWGTSFNPDWNGADKLIKGLLTGVKIELLPPGDPDNMAWIEQRDQLFNIDNEVEDNSFEWVELRSFTESNSATFSTDTNNRNNLLAAFGLDDASFLNSLGMDANTLSFIENDTELEQLPLTLSSSESITAGEYF